MRWFFLLILFCVRSLSADVSITTRANKSSLFINEQLIVDVAITYPKNMPPELFSFVYNLENSPDTAFNVVSVSIAKPQVSQAAATQTLQVTLAPRHTGSLVFAPGIITFGQQSYVVPPVGIECTSTELSTLPLAQLLPLYPERRIDLNAQNRLALFNDKVLQQAKMQNQQATAKYRLAWDSLAYSMGAVAIGALLLWVIVYYELLERARRPVKVKETPLQLLIRQVNDATLPIDVRWQKLADALREALGAKMAKNLQHLGLFELADYVSTNSTLSEEDKSLLLPAINTLGAICYAAKPSSDTEFNQLRASMLIWMKNAVAG